MALYPPPLGDKRKLISPGSLEGSPSPAPGQTSQFLNQFLKTEHIGGLKRTDLDPSDPVEQFHAWYNEAAAPGSGVAHPETCTLSTAQLPSGRVSARIVYMKELDARGFVIYSNFGTSGKARDLFGTPDGASTGNRWASLTFWWEPLERQVRVEGRAERIPATESQAYFDTRVRGSRIGAWSSRQSVVLPPDPAVEGDDGRAQLDRWVKEMEEKFEDVEDIPVPDFWGGLRIVPERVEFWQGRQNRLHDRFVYDRVEGEGDAGSASWTLSRLSP
ncbi:hypothetical protein VTJ49DRAFT_201 [Mycothermus thermophilus]|uniref:pyridoxal 5'-phosphate synthase n=1 Tax=Humicola insolens TaxID=85995 RepID=A0ABR3VHW5_HUMIN